ncbi:MAG: TerB family tellurite resistance protein [Balneola sp.]
MSNYALNDETSIDTLIFWIQSSDGSISYEEQETVKRILSNMKYDMSTYHKTLTQISAMGTDEVKDMANEAVDHIKRSFSDDGKKLTYNLLEAIAACDGKISDAEQAKLDAIKSELGV